MPRSLSFRFPIVLLILGIAVCALFGASSPFAQGEQVFKGQVIECACGGADAHSAMGATRATKMRCPDPCSTTHAKFLLLDSQHNVAFQFNKDDLPKTYANRDVFVIGILETASRTIEVNNVIPEVPPKVKSAKTISIVCDACPRAMAKARGAAFKELAGWGRYTILPEPKNAELIFLVSANPYLGDYITRDGPDKRLVHIDTVYANVVDPQTGQSLWGDRERVGSWFVTSATEDLVRELREITDADVSPVERKALVARNHIFKAINPEK